MSAVRLGVNLYSTPVLVVCGHRKKETYTITAFVQQINDFLQPKDGNWNFKLYRRCKEAFHVFHARDL